MKQAPRNSFKPNPVAASIILAMSSQLAPGTAHAGSGWGAGVNTSSVPVTVQTYYANSPAGPVPALDATGAPAFDPVTKLPILVDSGKALRKFVDTLPGLGPANANNLGQYIPLAVPEKNWTNPATGITTADDYYEIAAVEYSEKMHSDLPKATHLRGYVQLSTANNPGKHIPLTYPNGSPILDAKGVQVYAYDNPHHLGPVIQAASGTAVRIKFTNYLPVGGNLFLPVDTSLPGAGLGPDGINAYTQNRVGIHLVGGQSPWISAGSPHQWVAPAGEAAAYTAGLGKGVSTQNAPDMADPGNGSVTLYFPNTQGARFTFYQDRTSGLTRLNAYAGLEAGYLITDAAEQGLVASGAIPPDQIPLIIEDKTFVPNNVAQQDAKWDTLHWGQPGDLWFPHVYETNQDPNSIDGTNPVGRWDYGPWFWPVFSASQPLPSGNYGNASFTPEAYEDTPLVNGTAYPTLTVDPKAYRFRILNAGNDRYLNLGLYKADATFKAPQLDQNGNPIVDAAGNQLYFLNTEVKTVPAAADVAGNPPTPVYPGGLANTLCLCQYPALPQLQPAITFSGPTRGWPTDGRISGVPDPASVGPDFIAIGNDGGLLPSPVDIPSQPVAYEQNRRSITVTNIYGYGLLLGPSERADAIVDFSAYAGQTLILYNDAPAPTPFNDQRLDYFTGDPDLTSTGGAYSTNPGYGPNTHTIMQIKVNAAPVAATGAFKANTLLTALPAAYAASQPAPIVPESAYNPAFATNNPDTYAHVATGSAAQPNLDFTASGILTITGVNLVTSGGATAGNTPGSGTGYMSPPIVNFNNGACLPPGTPSAAATAVVDPITHQVTAVNLVNPLGYPGYTCAPTITFTPTAGGGAGIIASIGVATGGTGYTAPTVSITGGGGTGATATARIDSPVGAVTVANGGAGYTAPTVSITGGGGTGAAASATVSTSVLSPTVMVTAGGTGYTAPTVSIVGGGGTGATASATIAAPLAGTITVTNGGSGYSAPAVTFSGGGGTGATATATVGSTPVSGLTLVSGGAGYTTPTVSIVGGGGTGATATATVSSTPLAGLTLGNAGTGYTAPAVIFTGGGGSGATATATVASTPLAGLTLGNAGTGYTAPTVTFSGGGGSGAAATVTVSSTPVSSVAMVSGGTGYTAPVVSFSGGGGSGAAGDATVGTEPVTGVALAKGGSGYKSPVVYITSVDGNGSGAAATATTAGGVVTGITLTNGGAGYTAAPRVTIGDFNGSTPVRHSLATTAAATATVGPTAGAITGITLTNPGTGYTTPPAITITDATGTGASEKAVLGATAGAVTGITLTNPGSGYTTAPTVTIADSPGSAGAGATATTTVGPGAGSITGITLTNPGTGYASAPTVTIADSAGGSGKGATATAAIGPGAGILTGITLTNPGTGYTTAPLVSISDIAGGTGAGATATAALGATAGAVTGITLTNPGAGYTAAPAIAITDATGKGAAATAALAAASGVLAGITITNAGTGYTSVPTVSITDATGKGATATAALASPAGAVTGITVTNPGTGYTAIPTITITDATGAGAAATAALQFGPGAVTGITLTNPGTGYTSAPTITITDAIGIGATATAAISGTSGHGAQATVVASNSQSIPVRTKAEQELFDATGRYNSTAGVELPFTNATIQTTIPLSYIDSPTEIIGDGETQIWKIVDNGFWSNSMHFDFVDVQLINRVGWDGTVKPPASNEVGWKDTLRLNPLEDVVIAMRAKPQAVPFGLPQSVRPQDPSVKLSAAGSGLGFIADPAVTTLPTDIPPNAPLLTTTTNVTANYDNEYVWNSAILGHSEDDLMRPIVYAPIVSIPDAPANLAGVAGVLSWTDPTPALAPATLANPKNEIGFIVQRSTDGNTFTEAGRAPANATSWTDPVQAPGMSYWYNVVAYNAKGNSLPSNTITVQYPLPPPAAPTNLTAALAGAAINLAWTNNAPNATVYVVEVSVNGGAYNVLATLPPTATSYADTTIVPGNGDTYSYRVMAQITLNGMTASSAYAYSVPAGIVVP